MIDYLYEHQFESLKEDFDTGRPIICSLEKCLQYKYVEQLINRNN